MSSRAAKDIRPDGIEILGSEWVAARMCCVQKFAQCRDKMCQWRRVTKAKVTVQSLARIKLSDVETLNDRLNVKYRGEFKTLKSRLGSERKCEGQEIQKTVRETRQQYWPAVSGSESEGKTELVTQARESPLGGW